MAVVRTLKMIWETQKNNTITYNIPEPVASITKTGVETVMEWAVDNAALQKSDLDLAIGVKDAYIYETQVIELE